MNDHRDSAPAAQCLGATPEEWAHWQRLGLTPDMLAVVSDPTVPISPSSKLTQLDGKTPSQIGADGKAIGIAGWTKRVTTERDIARWSADGRHGIGLVGRTVKAFDIDIADPVHAAAVADFLELTLGALPCRTRSNSGKCLLILVMVAGELPKAVIRTAHGAIERLGELQQFLVSGVHKTGVRYEWEGGLPAAIPELTRDEVLAAWEALGAAFGVPGGVSTGKASIALQRPRSAADADDPAVPFLYDHEWVVGEHSDGKLDVRCPNEAEHTAGDDPSATVYLPAGVGGETLPGFRCLHAHCTGINGARFLRLVGFDDAAADFEVITLTDEEAARAADAAIRNARKRAVSIDDFYAHGPDHKFIHRPTRALWPAASVDGMVQPWPTVQVAGKPKPMPPSRWLDQHQAVQQMTWLPGAPEIIENQTMLPSGWAPRPGARVYNRYLPPPPHIGDAAQAGPWLEHGRRLYPDEWDQMLYWFAHRLQRPGEKVNHALVLGGDQGIGKDSILVPVKVGVGASNVEDIAPAALMGGFNGFAASVLVVVSEARNLGEHDRFELYEQSKTYICAPPDVLRVNEKNLREYYVPNLCGVIFTTNHRTSGLYLPADDRRHFVAWSEANRTQFEVGYFANLYRWYAGGGVGHVLAYLHSVDLAGFDAKAEPPKTAAFWAMVQAGEAPESSELRSVIEAMGSPDAVTVRALALKAAQIGMHDLSSELRDRKTRARLPHMLDRVDYVSVHNPDNKRGRFGAETVYAKKALSFSAQVRAARGAMVAVSAGDDSAADFA